MSETVKKQTNKKNHYLKDGACKMFIKGQWCTRGLYILMILMTKQQPRQRFMPTRLTKVPNSPLLRDNDNYVLFFRLCMFALRIWIKTCRWYCCNPKSIGRRLIQLFVCWLTEPKQNPCHCPIIYYTDCTVSVTQNNAHLSLSDMGMKQIPDHTSDSCLLWYVFSISTLESGSSRSLCQVSRSGKHGRMCTLTKITLRSERKHLQPHIIRLWVWAPCSEVKLVRAQVQNDLWIHPSKTHHLASWRPRLCDYGHGWFGCQTACCVNLIFQ